MKWPTFAVGDRVAVNEEHVVVFDRVERTEEGLKFISDQPNVEGTVTGVHRLRAFVTWDDGIKDDWFVGDLIRVDST